MYVPVDISLSRYDPHSLTANWLVGGNRQIARNAAADRIVRLGQNR